MLLQTAAPFPTLNHILSVKYPLPAKEIDLLSTILQSFMLGIYNDLISYSSEIKSYQIRGTTLPNGSTVS